MKDEIKEILDFLKDKDDYIEEYGYKYKRISLEDTKILLDYITNLQDKVEWYENIEINKTIDKFRLEHNKEIKRLNKENERLKENAIHNDKVVDKAKWQEMIYKSKIEKATVILKNIYLLDNVSITNNAVEEIDKAINILQGVDKDE